MTKKQFLDAVNEIDDEFINEIIDIHDESRENYFADEQPQVVYLTNKPIPFWKIAFSAAAMIFVIAAGLFAVLKLQAPQVTPPNEGVISENVLSSDSCSDSSSESETISDPISAIPEKSDRVRNEGDLFGAQMIGENKTFCSDYVVKSDDENYAMVLFDEIRGITERNPLCISVSKRVGEERSRQVSEEVVITDNDIREIRIDYTKPVEEGEELMLIITVSNENAAVKVAWLP